MLYDAVHGIFVLNYFPGSGYVWLLLWTLGWLALVGLAFTSNPNPNPNPNPDPNPNLNPNPNPNTNTNTNPNPTSRYRGGAHGQIRQVLPHDRVLCMPQVRRSHLFVPGQV